MSLRELLFFNTLNRSLCRLTTQLYSHLLSASLLQDEHAGLSILPTIYSPKRKKKTPPKTKENPVTTKDELFTLPLNTIIENAHSRSAVTKCLKLYNYQVSSSLLYADSVPTSLNKQLHQESEAFQWGQSYSVPGEQLFFATESSSVQYHLQGISLHNYSPVISQLL